MPVLEGLVWECSDILGEELVWGSGKEKLQIINFNLTVSFVTL